MKIALHVMGLLFCVLNIYAKWDIISLPNNGFPNNYSVIGRVAVDLNQPNIIYCELYYHRLYISFNNGDNWSEIKNFPHVSGNIGEIAGRYPNIAVIGDSGNDLFITTDAGESWKKIDTLCYYNDYFGVGHEIPSCLIKFMRLRYFDDILYVGGSNGFFKSTNNGIDWVPLLGHNIPELETEPRSWYVKGDTIVLRANGILFSSDKGQTWELRINGIKEATHISQYKDIKFLFAINDTLFVTFDKPALQFEDVLYESTDFGESWHQIFIFPLNWGEPAPYYYSSMPTICNNNMIFVARGFLYMVQDFGKSWKDITYSDGLKYVENYGYINQCIFNDKYMFTTNELSLYRTRYENCEFVDLINNVNNQKYENDNLRIIPNPTSDNIIINFTYPKFGLAEIEIMNYMGIKVKSVQVQKSKEVELDVSDLPSGIYFATICSGGQVQTEKFVISR